jgi:hypothetical protein
MDKALKPSNSEYPPLYCQMFTTSCRLLLFLSLCPIFMMGVFTRKLRFWSPNHIHSYIWNHSFIIWINYVNNTLHTNHNLLNVLVQVANKMGLQKKNLVSPRTKQKKHMTAYTELWYDHPQKDPSHFRCGRFRLACDRTQDVITALKSRNITIKTRTYNTQLQRCGNLRPTYGDNTKVLSEIFYDPMGNIKTVCLSLRLTCGTNTDHTTDEISDRWRNHGCLYQQCVTDATAGKWIW